MKPMLANTLEIGLEKHERQWARVMNEDYTMEPKLDGIRLLLSFDQHGRLFQAFTRSGRNVIDQVPALWKLECPELPAWTVLDCEFGYVIRPDLIDFNQTMRVMGSGHAEAQRKAYEIKFLPTAHVFDILMTGDRWTSGLPQGERREMIESLHAPKKSWHGMRLTDSHVVLGYEHFDAFYTTYVNYGGEGVMLKNTMATYVQESRPTQTWYKVKKFATADVVITGFQEGQGKYKGQVGAVKFGFYERNNALGGGGQLVECGQCSGMDDMTRLLITASQAALMHSVMEVRYFGLTAGTMRHPQFLRLRQDKKMFECTPDQVS